jgi:hypothetical protein
MQFSTVQVEMMTEAMTPLMFESTISITINHIYKSRNLLSPATLCFLLVSWCGRLVVPCMMHGCMADPIMRIPPKELIY